MKKINEIYIVESVYTLLALLSVEGLVEIRKRIDIILSTEKKHEEDSNILPG
ncbi:MAG: hypothetical protein GY861_18845 [bacterium]|nr:hypothetical protein [bacterium]